MFRRKVKVFFVKWADIIPAQKTNDLAPNQRGGPIVYSETLALFIKSKNDTDDYQQIFAIQQGASQCSAKYVERQTIKLWECIRGFMDDDSDKSPTPKRKCASQEKGDDINKKFKNWFLYRKHPTFTNSEVIEWSKPIAQCNT